MVSPNVDILLVGIIGLVAGGVVNMLADALPAGVAIFPPKYSDGSPRPVSAWLGVGALLFGRRTNAKLGESTPRLSLRQPVTELALAALMVLAQLKLGQAAAAQMLALHLALVILVLIAVVDIEQQRILATPLAALGALALMDALLLPQLPPAFPSALAGGVVAGMTFFLVYLGGRLYVRCVLRPLDPRQTVIAFGLGDVYLMAVCGLLVGLPNVLALMLVTVVLGGLGALAWLAQMRLRGRAYQRHISLAYAPYIVAASIVVLLFQSEVGAFFWGMTV